MRIPVTRSFDKTDLLGYLELRDDVEIEPESVFVLGYTVLVHNEDGTPKKIHVQEVSLIPAKYSVLQSVREVSNDT